MSKHNFDIIHSTEAETFLRMVTKGFYNNSYIGLWMYEVIGREWDEMRKWAEGLKDEINPQTCTWSIGIWEWVYGIETDKTLQLEYRRQRILAKILGTKPINPEAIRRGVARITGCDIDITDFAGPYRFALKVHMREDGDAIPYESVREYIRTVKPSHLAAFLTWVFLVVIDSTQLEQFLPLSVQMHWYIPFWGAKLVNGTKLLDGSGLLNASRRYNLVPGIKNNIKAHIKENIYTGRLYINILPCFNVLENINGLKTVLRLGSCWFFIFSDGKQDMPLSITVPVYAHIVQEINIARIVINGIEVHTKEKTGAASVLRAAINSLPVKSSLPLKTGFVSQINTSQNTDISSLVYSGMEVHTEEKAGAASGLKAGINHYKIQGSTRAVPARIWYKAAVVTHENIQGFTVITEPVQVLFDSSGLANADFEVVYNGNVVLNPESLTVYKGDFITINILPGEHYSLADGAYVSLNTGNTYALDNGTVTIKIKQECTARIRVQAVPGRHTVNFIHDLTCGFELEHNGKKYINPQSLVVTYGDGINIRLLTTHNGNFATPPTLTYGGKVTGFDGDGLNCYKNITVNGDMDITVYTDYIFGPYDPVYPDDDFDPAHADTPDVITAVDGDIYLSTRQPYSIILKYARSVTNFVIDARSYVQVSLQYTDNNGKLSDYRVQADNRMLCLVNFMYNRCKPGTDLKIDIQSLDYSIKSKIHIAYSTKLLPNHLTLKAKDSYEMTGVPAIVALTTDISSYSVRVGAKPDPSYSSMSEPQELKPDRIVIFKNPYSLVFIPSPLNDGYYDIYYFTRQG